MENLKFINISRGTWIPDAGQMTAYLKDDYWDDYSYKTLFSLHVFDENGEGHRIGQVKIGKFNQGFGRTETPQNFQQLNEEYFSLGQDTDYYLALNKLSDSLKTSILRALNDIVYDKDLQERAIKESVTRTSLLRGVSLTSVQDQFYRIIIGQAPLTDYNFSYKSGGVEMSFSVQPHVNPPTNIHVIIGRNGVGKTHFLNSITEALLSEEEKRKEVGGFIFAGLVSVAFNAFDPFPPRLEQEDKTIGIPYSYVGLRRATNRGGKAGTPMSPEMLANDFFQSLNSCLALGRKSRWKAAIKNLESDPLFAEIGLLHYIDNYEESTFKSIFKKLSSGHSIVLLTITKLVEKVEEKTLVLLDEPESHLHPPLLSAFTRSLSELLINRNGVAIVATHSPVIMQEVPKCCVWKLNRIGKYATASRPGIETFGENVGTLTREVFSLEVTNSGFHKLLESSLSKGLDYEGTVNEFKNQLGSEARSILFGMIADRDNQIK